MVERVSIYRAPTTVADAEALASWLDERVEASVGVRDRFLARTEEANLAERFARARVLSPYDPETGSEMLGVIRYEARAIDDPSRAGGVIYDGLAVQRILGDLLPPDEAGLNHLHIPLLDRVLGTWGSHDGRWHKRVHILGQPTVVSVPGLYEAPAKPESYYREQQRHALVTGDPPPREVLEERVEGAFLVADDPRTTEVLAGYVLQAVHYLETGDPFCEHPECRLHNAHRQPALIRAQLEEPSLCPAHAERYG